MTTSFLPTNQSQFRPFGGQITGTTQFGQQATSTGTFRPSFGTSTTGGMTTSSNFGGFNPTGTSGLTFTGGIGSSGMNLQ
jgi:hypothetical protein